MSNNRLATALKSCEQNGEKAFIPYIMAGDGELSSLKEQLLFFEQQGATAVELGIPFSDPVADGPVIQRAGIRALNNGTTLKKILEELQDIREDVSIPLIFMGYSNSILAYGIGQFVTDCVKAGIAGCIIPDVPVEEEGLFAPIQEAGIHLIRLVTLTSSKERIAEIAETAQGFIYAVTVTGITGAREAFGSEVGAYLEQVKEISPVPVLAGFGISTPEHVRSATKYCDGVIVGSKIIESLEQNRKQDIIELIQASKKQVQQ
ncbi:tryptophan synthase subunit alpha [Peribacillus asahii]|uniref:tryptophan synthase subunit alpha n=1 Tax=Peribacillus asahii TaxID=228899 RepID=UPI003804105D